KKDSLMFDKEPVVITADESYEDSYTPATQPANTEKLVYTVKSGDILGYISSWYSVSVSDIKSWNGLYSNNLQIGQKIIIYKPNGVASKYRNIDSMSFVDKQKMANPGSTTSSTNKTTASGNNTTASLDPKYEYYTIQAGDNPWKIANKYNNVSVDDIMKLNNITDPSSLRVGQKIKIRKKV
ncbi:MAG TPA: LysM peptidoglycan-binding domain-containing protein, partial [Bacteroidales bacterium]|nr:LysM peptidoglycan-binding domain-containing protein [Bacteroidales bacterium]